MRGVCECGHKECFHENVFERAGTNQNNFVISQRCRVGNNFNILKALFGIQGCECVRFVRTK